MKKYTTSQRLHQIMESRNLRQVDILEAARPYCQKYDVKLGRNDLSQYVTGKVEPGQEKLTILGLALNVSEAWLMGYDLPPERTQSTDTSTELDDGRGNEFSELFNMLSPDQQSMIVGAMKGILSNKS